MLDFVFISGMFRSGTTLLGRLINAHKEVAIATDPYMFFFKSFRNEIAKIHEITIDSESPLGDYYFSVEKLKLLKAIQTASFDTAFNLSHLDELREGIYSCGINYSPLIMPHMDEINGKTYTGKFNNSDKNKTTKVKVGTL